MKATKAQQSNAENEGRAPGDESQEGIAVVAIEHVQANAMAVLVMVLARTG